MDNAADLASNIGEFRTQSHALPLLAGECFVDWSHKDVIQSKCVDLLYLAPETRIFDFHGPVAGRWTNVDECRAGKPLPAVRPTQISQKPSKVSSSAAAGFRVANRQ